MKTRTLGFALVLAACSGSSEEPGPSEEQLTGEPALASPTPSPAAQSSANDVAPATPNTPAPVPTTTTPNTPPPAPTTPSGAFTGANAFVAKLGPSARNRDHKFAGNVAGSPAGQPCLTCHTGDRGDAPNFIFAGTAYRGTAPAASVEVRVRDAAGKAFSAYTDADGNFFVRGNAALAAPAQAGVRDATTVRLMTNVITDGDCNSCHRDGAQGKITL